MAITALSEAGITRANILASTVEKNAGIGKFFDTMHAHNSSSQFDLPMILGALMSLMGCIYGYILSWGPIIWGIIGGLGGFFLGLLIKYILFRKRKAGSIESEVVIFVCCEEYQSDTVRKLFLDNGALGVSLIAGTK